ncbi:hypothetical protein J4477_04700 [Candidatus Pacearchaeota archaeon]|nr:hypothetical protein [Candidatus Pacearchaeota archaeon]
MEEMKNKIYNPLKMWGSWAGLLVLVILSLVSLMAPNPIGFYYIIVIALIFNLVGIDILNTGSFGFLPGSPSEIGIIIIVVFSAIIGFVMGWVINSIFRYINNKKI